MYVYVSEERLKENLIVAVRTESEKVENHEGNNMSVTPSVFPGKEVVVVITCVDREENECRVKALGALQVKFSFVKRQSMCLQGKSQFTAILKTVQSPHFKFY